MKHPVATALAVVTCLVAPFAAKAGSKDEQQARIDRGRYLVQIAGCNDCHTAGYAPAAGAVPEADWLKGDVVGWQGPWGTTYAINLRLFASRISEAQWVTLARNGQARPPMPWWIMREMDEKDLRAIYTFIRSLPVAGPEAPAALEPGVTPGTAYFQFVAPAQ